MVQNIKLKFPLGEEENWNTNSPSQVFPHDVSAVVLNKACHHLGSSNFPGTEETVHKFSTMPLSVSWGHSMFNLSRYPPWFRKHHCLRLQHWAQQSAEIRESVRTPSSLSIPWNSSPKAAVCGEGEQTVGPFCKDQRCFPWSQWYFHLPKLKSEDNRQRHTLNRFIYLLI